ncbi:MAG: hypothetical protein QGH45_25115, partial [Myxococcota bacterium]|nr:hypothetical protein [Myxococcota bacterium]
LREARRADARLECALSDLARFEDDVRTYDPGNRFVNRLLEQGYRQNRVISLDRDQAEVVARGRAGGGTGAGGSGGSTGAPGRWIAGLAGADERIAELQSADPGGGQSAGTPAGDPGGPPQAGRWVERRYEGPLPEPTGPWDPGLLAALRDHQPALDDVDVAVLLQLIELAFAELPDRTAVEGAVWRSLSIPGGLELFGQESQLSELLADAYDSGEQPEIVFVLRLWI